MLVALIILGIVGIMLLIFFAIVFSTLKIEVFKFDVSMKEEYIEKCGEISKSRAKTTVEDYQILVEMCLFKKIKLYSKVINDKNIKEIEKGRLIKWIDKKLNRKVEEEIKDLTQLIFKERKMIFRKETLEHMKNLKVKIPEMNLDIQVGTENPVTTAYLVGIIASIISMVLAYSIKKEDVEKVKYKVNPLYVNQNFLKMQLNCIIKVKTVHIMNMIYLLPSRKHNLPLRIQDARVKKKRSDKEYGATSNRRSYGNNYEQYTRYG